MVIAAIKLEPCSLKEKVIKTLLPERNMLSLDSILKTRDITLPTKVPIIKAVFFFPVVIYGCESYTIKKAERQKELMFLNCGVGEDS